MRRLFALLLFFPLFLSANEAEQRYLTDYLRVIGDLNGAETVFHYSGTVYSIVPDQKSMELFDFEGFSIARIDSSEAGYRLMGKEVGLFLDHRTSEVLKNWRNPFTQATVPVIHIWNDPVNQRFEYDAKTIPYIRQFLPSTVIEESIVYHSELFPFYPHVLSRKLFGDHVQSDYFQSAELREYRAKLADLENVQASSVPAEISFTWICPWLPFMRMGDREGQMLFVLRGRKLEHGYSDLPQHIRDTVKSINPDFAHSPREYLEPDMNPWIYFRDLQQNTVETP
ncbi:MAG: DUF1838 family protein [Candidatus Cloacimonetes bacterium]|nr:DUF1838 domain-containing protein [Candidatus Cloacimonadota bacterium]MDD2505778.1 DUF1838 family protein [Candidatus Cloacimonadota bacterium]MDD4147654.1 DUF1838 family protein [Candidatus Cloacimonadota bacterium]MDD4559200.1 DUF1838 family protein [Candidatus Cloacimonadota bacterium]